MEKPQPHVAYDMTYSMNFRWFVNSRSSTADETDEFDEHYSSSERIPNAPAPLCPFCEVRTEQAEFTKGSMYFDDEPEGRDYHLVNCVHCGYWSFQAHEGTKHCSDAPLIIDAQSVLRKFDTPIPEGCGTEIAQQLRRDPSFWHTMNTRDMERFVADIFRANYKHAEVMHVGKPGDLGIDVVYVDANGDDWLVQVKRRESSDAVEGFETLQRLLGTLALEGKVRGIIASTAERFSRQLQTQRLRAEERGFEIELLDRGKLDRMLSPLLPCRPWLSVIDSGMLNLFDEEARRHFLRSTSDPRQPSLF